MTITRWQRPGTAYWSPFRHLNSLREEIDRLFDTPVAGLAGTSQQLLSGWHPRLDLHEDEHSVFVRLELPGMRKEDIDISLHDGMLSVSGERKDDNRFESAEIYRAERFTGRFHRTITLPTRVQVDNVKATYVDGVLTITLPKADEVKPKQITVTAK